MTSKSLKVAKGHQNHLFLRYILCLKPNLFKTFQECQQYEDTNF